MCEAARVPQPCPQRERFLAEHASAMQIALFSCQVAEITQCRGNPAFLAQLPQNDHRRFLEPNRRFDVAGETSKLTRTDRAPDPIRGQIVGRVKDSLRPGVALADVALADPEERERPDRSGRACLLSSVEEP